MNTVTAAVILTLALAPVASAQDQPPPPAPGAGNSGQSAPLPRRRPAEQFAPCTEITDLEARGACIERQTEKGNPTVRSLDDDEQPPNKK
jgi:hypothetical protein